MKKIIFSIVSAIIAFYAKAEEYVETYNIISDQYSPVIQDAQIVRRINGGTVITPVFDESCPEEMKAPFAFACKIVEEYMPPCLPLKVNVSCGRLTGSYSKAVSMVKSLCQLNFGGNTVYSYVPMSLIKGVILSEYCYNSTITYLNYIPNKVFLTGKPDIEIQYNGQRLDEISFSLEPAPDQKYDFVSLAVRDLLIGLGFNSSFRYNRVSQTLDNPNRELTPFEISIDKALGNQNNAAARLAAATKGELELGLFANRGPKLYAPSDWENGRSLNYFIPQDDFCISNILSYNFCKGMVTRSLSDNYSLHVFRNLLGWKPDYVTSSSTPESSAGGSTSLKMPYNGTISFNDNTYGITTIVDSELVNRRMLAHNVIESDNVYDYVEAFHPFLDNGESTSEYGTSISILKKDGTWDLVKFIDGFIYDYTFNMSDWTFNYEESEYARTIDGYLKARITSKSRNDFGRLRYKSTFFVIDYLPQKVELSYAFMDSENAKAQTETSSNKVRLYFYNTEGANRIILESLRQGARVPGKAEIYDFKKGYYDTTIDRTTTFTAVAYNDNGGARGIPVTVVPVTDLSPVSFSRNGDIIHVETQNKSVSEYSYSIVSIDSPGSTCKHGVATETIDISLIQEGFYILTVTDKASGKSDSFKFRK